jgi:hypothetical protein
MPTPDHKPHYEQSEELKALAVALDLGEGGDEAVGAVGGGVGRGHQGGEDGEEHADPDEGGDEEEDGLLVEDAGEPLEAVEPAGRRALGGEQGLEFFGLLVVGLVVGGGHGAVWFGGWQGKG